MATTAHWVRTGSNGTVASGSAIPDLTVNIPVNATVQRVVFGGFAAALNNAPTDGNKTLVPFYLLQTAYLQYGLATPKILHEGYRRIPHALALMFDSTQAAGSNRIYQMLHSAGDDDIGLNLQMSWGGPGSTACKVYIQQIFWKMFSATGNNLTFSYEFLLKVLYRS
jgi:hypothetical protein